jgi:hypothetical protein
MTANDPAAHDRKSFDGRPWPGHAHYAFTLIPQRLLAGDADTVIV